MCSIYDTSTFFHNHANLREISFKENFAAGCEISQLTNGIPPNQPCTTSSFAREEGAIRLTKGHREISAIKSWLLQLDGPYLRRFFEGRSEPTPSENLPNARPPLVHSYRDRPPSGSSPNRANKQPQRDVERQL